MTTTGNGTVTSADTNISCPGTCNFTYPAGTQVTLNELPSGTGVFSGWGGDCTGTTSSCMVTLTQDRTVSAAFADTFALTVQVFGGGTVTSTPAGINCLESTGTCTALFVDGTNVNLANAPASGWKFNTWGGDCTGTGACSTSMTAARFVSAEFGGPFDFSIAQSLPNSTLTMVQGESRFALITLTLTNGSGLPVSLTAADLPAGVTASFAPPSVTPNGTTTLTLTASASAALGPQQIKVTGTSGSLSHDAYINLLVRSPYELGSPFGVTLEAGGTTALVTDDGNPIARMVRIETATRKVIKTIYETSNSLRRMAIESGGVNVLVASNHALLRVNLPTFTATQITATDAIQGLESVAIESGASTAIVSNCGPTNNCAMGRLDRVTLSTGAITPLTTAGINSARDLALEAGGGSAIVAEGNSGRLLRITLTNGAQQPLATGLDQIAAVALEAGGASAIVTYQGTVSRLTLATGVHTQITRLPDAIDQGRSIAIEAGGATALASHQLPAPGGGRVIRIPLTHPIRALAPARQSFDVLFETFGVALEAGGTTALVTDCGAPSCTSGSGRLLRVDLTTGMVTIRATGLSAPRGISIESGGNTALVADSGAQRLVRVNLTTGVVTPITSGFTGQLLDVIAEANGTTALISHLLFPGSSIQRVTLSSGARTTIGTFPSANFGGGIALEAGGTTALVTTTYPDGLARMNLSTGALTQLTTGFSQPVGVAIEPGGSTALVVENQGATSRLFRVNVTTGAYTLIAPNIYPGTSVSTNGGGGQFIAIEPGGTTLVAISLTLMRVGTAPRTPVALTPGLIGPRGFTLNSTQALFTDCGNNTPNCLSTGRVAAADLTTGVVTTIASGLNKPNAITLEASGTTALVTECGPSNQSCSTHGRLLRVTLANGSIALVASGLDNPDGIAIEAGGTSALVCERGQARLIRVDLASGTNTVVATGLSFCSGVRIEAGGLSALVTSSIGLVRVNLLATNSIKTLYPGVITAFAIEPGGASVLIGYATQCCGVTGQFGRVNLTSGSLDVLAGPFFAQLYAMGFDSTGTNFYYADAPIDYFPTGTLFKMAAP